MIRLLRFAFTLKLKKPWTFWFDANRSIAYWPITIKFRTREQATKPQTNYCCCLRFTLTSTSSPYSVLLNFVTKVHFVTMPLSPSRHVNMADSRWMEGSGRAIKKWGKTLDCVSCFPLHFFRALPLPACFTTELSTVEASLFVNYIIRTLSSGPICDRIKEVWGSITRSVKLPHVPVTEFLQSDLF